VLVVSDLFSRQRSPHCNGVAMSMSEKTASLINPPPCPRCHVPMFLSRLEPHPSPTGGTDDIFYECACGEQLTKTVPSS